MALDDERGERYIETIPAKGYRFIGMVAPIGLDAVWFDDDAKAGAGDKGRWSYGWAAAGLLILAVAIGAALRGTFASTPVAAPNGSVSSLVVIPFQTAGSSGDQNYLGVGMADALAMRLGAVEQLRVPPAAAVQPREDAFEAGRRLEVDAVLTGFVQRDGERVRVTAQLSQVSDRRQLWTARFDDNFTDIFAVQDAIAERITSSLIRDVNAGQRAALHRRETANAEAYDRYLRGREQWSRRTVAATQAAIQSYQEAIALDPALRRGVCRTRRRLRRQRLGHAAGRAVPARARRGRSRAGDQPRARRHPGRSRLSPLSRRLEVRRGEAGAEKGHRARSAEQPGASPSRTGAQAAAANGPRRSPSSAARTSSTRIIPAPMSTWRSCCCFSAAWPRRTRS